MLKIDQELKDLIPPLSSDEYATLEKSILDEGCRDKIITWNDIIVDGHNRYEICTKHNLPCATEDRDFESKENVKVWMIDNQKGRRNLTDGWKFELAQARKAILAEKGKENQIRKPADSVLSTVDKTKHNTREEIAKDLGWGTGKVARAEKVWKEAKPEVKEKIKAGEISFNQAYNDIKKEEKKADKERRAEERNKAVDSIHDKSDNEITDLQAGWHKIGNQFLYYGSNNDADFIEFVPECKFAFADPPYNAGVDDWDNDFTWGQDFLQDIAEIVAVTPGGWNACNFYRGTSMTYQWEMACWIKNGMTHGRCGYANWIKVSVFGLEKPKIQQDFFHITIKPSETDDTYHKGRKPYEFMAYLIDAFSNESENIIDPFAGSGTTLLMSEKMHRISYSAEIDKTYCMKIINRGIANGMIYERL